MVPPPSAVMQPSMHTPAQSMLRLPAESAAVIACAASATSDNPYKTISLGGKPRIATPWNGVPTLRRGFHDEQGRIRRGILLADFEKLFWQRKPHSLPPLVSHHPRDPS